MKEGMRALVENSSMPTKKPNMVVPRKLPSLARSRWKNGCSAVMVWVTNTHSPAAAKAASVQISTDSNQSWLGPRSIISWKAPMNSANPPKPKKSKGLCLPPSSSSMKAWMPR